MNDEEIKMYEDAIKIMQRAQISGAEASRLIQIQQFFLNTIKELRQPEDAGD